MKAITLRQQKFVAAYCSGKSARESAILAGYAHGSARNRGNLLLAENPGVQQVVAEYRANLQEATGYNQEKAVAELDAGIAFAMETKNATALARFSELKMKLHGLLDKDRDAGGSSFQNNIVGLSDPSGRSNGAA